MFHPLLKTKASRPCPCVSAWSGTEQALSAPAATHEWTRWASRSRTLMRSVDGEPETLPAQKRLTPLACCRMERKLKGLSDCDGFCWTNKSNLSGLSWRNYLRTQLVVDRNITS